MITSSGILQSYLMDCFNSSKSLCYEELLKYRHQVLLDHKLYSDDNGFLTPLNFYLGILDNADNVLIPYLSQVKKDQLCHDLQITYLLLLTQKEYELRHQKVENTANYDDQLIRCETLLDALNACWQQVLKKAPEQNYFSAGKPVKYLGISVAKEFADKLVGFGTSKTIKQYLGALNERRLYWVWGSSFLKTLLGLVADDFHHAKQAGEIAKIPDPYTGCLSWGLYYFRFSLNLFLLLKHTMHHPWMSDDEAAVPWYERFQSQWAQRKFTLLNDSLWATANLLCFFWLNGKGALGAGGDALTIVLLLFDVSVALWDFEEQQAQHKAQIIQYDEDLTTLRKTRDLLLIGDKKSRLNRQINTLEQAKTQCIKAWELQKLSLYNNAAYAIGLMLAFVVFTMPFVPISAPAALILSTVGAVLCFAFTVINNAMRGGIEIYKACDAIKDNEENFVAHISLLREILVQNPQLHESQKRLLFLEIKKFDAQTEYQRQIAVLQSVHLVRSILFEALIPAVIFSSLVFFPLGVGLGMLAGALGLAMASNVLINALLTPNKKMVTISLLHDKEYEAFCALAQNKDNSAKDYHTFFRGKEGLTMEPELGSDALPSFPRED